jgi:branched-chain amino acid aminotransferase
VILNGKLRDEAETGVSVFDRSFCYGDGLFETFRVHNGLAFRLADHLARLRTSADQLGFAVPFSNADIEDHVDALVAENDLPEAMVRIHLSRGTGRRGYSPRGANEPAYVLSAHPAPPITPGRPPAWRMRTSPHRWHSDDPLVRHKTASRLINVIAKAEAEEAGYDDAFFVNEHGDVVEATCANVFWFEGNLVCTPPLTAGVLPGVTRRTLLQLAAANGLKTEEKNLPISRLKVVDGAFLSLSSFGVIEISRIDQTILPVHELTARLQRLWHESVKRETR